MPPDLRRLVADRLSCRRGERLLFENLSFVLEKGTGLALVGPNGIGKTSLLRILAGLLRPSGGSIRFEPDRDVPLTERSHFVGVQDGLKGGLTPHEQVSFWMAADAGASRGSAGDRQGRAAEALAEWDVAPFASMPIAWLSTGQRRRVALARLICTARQVWLLDEPMNGLDAWASTRLRALAERHMASGGVVIAASHQGLGWTGLSTLDLGGTAAPRPPGPTA